MIKSMEKWNSSNIWDTTLINQNSIQEEIKNRLKVGNACYYHSVHYLLPSSLLSKNIKIKV
jgi:hypothetical protein